MEQILFVAFQRQRPRHPFCVAAFQQYSQELIDGQCTHSCEEIGHPVAVSSRQNLVEENAGEQRGDQCNERPHQCEGKCQPECFSCPAQVFTHVRQYAGLLAAGTKLFCGFECQTDSGKLFPELLHRPLDHTSAGVVQTGISLAVETSEHNEMPEVPMDDGGLHAFECLCRHTLTMGF